MLLAPLVLVAALGQASGPTLAPQQGACPAPLTRYGPPPCAASNVPGCVPGYRRTVDAWGRTTYVCDPQAYQAAPAPPPPQAEPAPQGYPPPPAYVPPPPAPRAAPRYAPPPPAWAGPREAPRGQLGLVLLPGSVSRLEGSPGYSDSTGALGLSLELRGPWGGERLRFGFEGSGDARLMDVGLKYDFNDGGILRPFLSLALGGASIDQTSTLPIDSGLYFTVAGSLGLDLYVSRNLFLTFELKQRGFMVRTVAPDGYTDLSTLRQTGFFFGVGLYL